MELGVRLLNVSIPFFSFVPCCRMAKNQCQSDPTAINTASFSRGHNYNIDANEKECSTKPGRGNVVVLT